MRLWLLLFGCVSVCVRAFLLSGCLCEYGRLCGPNCGRATRGCVWVHGCVCVCVSVHVDVVVVRGCVLSFGVVQACGLLLAGCSLFVLRQARPP
jgi:hypothetical protein